MTESIEACPPQPAAEQAADPALTLATRKLAGSPQCLNCGTELKGPFCYYCGQPDRNLARFFPALLRDLLEDLLDLDSRFVRTLKPLLFKPGRLTRDYMQGRRFRYTPPMRLYVFASIVFFLLATLLSGDVISINDPSHQGDNGPIIQISTETNAEKEQLEKLGDALQSLPLDESAQTEIAAILAEEDTDEPIISKHDFTFNDKPWDRETNPVDVPWLPDRINVLINDEIEESPKKAALLDENPGLIVDKMLDILPATMFVLLPFVALIFKFWYLFAKRFYVEHLIFSLHNHAFIFCCLILLLLISTAADFFSASGFAAVATVSNWLQMVIWIWIPVYLLISLRVVYQQNWLLTIGKFLIIGASYMLVLSLVTAGVAITGFILL